MNRARWIPLCGALAAMVTSAAARAGGDAAKAPALDALVTALAKGDALDGQLEATVKVPGSDEDHAVLRLRLKRPLFARYEMQHGKDDPVGGTFVCDGKQLWTCDSDSKKCWPTPVDPSSKPTSPVSTPALDWLVTAFYDAPAIAAGKTDAPWKSQLASARTSEDTIGGEACDVVRLDTPTGSATFAFSKKTGMPRRIVDELKQGETITLTWEISKLDPAAKLEDSAFAFVLPDGYQKADAPPSPEGELLAVGSEAPDIGGDSPTAGKPLKLSDYRGKVVLLNFWFEH